MKEKERSPICKKTFSVTMLLLICVFVFSASASATVFTDTENHWAKNSIDYVTNQGYFVGTSSTAFSPDTNMTRGMFVAVLSRISSDDVSSYRNTVFSDVPAGSYYESAIAWAYQKNIVSGMSASAFHPDDPVTREQICMLLTKYLEYTKANPEIKTTAVTTYNDDASISSWAHEAVYTMQKYGYLVGSDGRFRPKDCATRGECASIFARLCGYFYNNNVVIDDNRDDTDILPDNDDTLSGGTLLGDFNISFYCPCSTCNGGWSGSASGLPMVPGKTIAVDKNVIPLGSWVRIEFSAPRLQHLNGVYQAVDTGSAIVNNRIDVLVEDHQLAYTYGIDSGVKVYLLDK